MDDARTERAMRYARQHAGTLLDVKGDRIPEENLRRFCTGLADAVQDEDGRKAVERRLLKRLADRFDGKLEEAEQAKDNGDDFQYHDGLGDGFDWCESYCLRLLRELDEPVEDVPAPFDAAKREKAAEWLYYADLIDGETGMWDDVLWPAAGNDIRDTYRAEADRLFAAMLDDREGESK